jgi:hypothetical protein
MSVGAVFKFGAWIVLGLIILPVLANWGLALIYSVNYKPLNSGPTSPRLDIAKVDVGRSNFESLSIASDQQTFRVVLGYPTALDAGQKNVDLIFLTLDARGKVLSRTVDASATTTEAVTSATKFLRGTLPLVEVLPLNQLRFDKSHAMHVSHFWKRTFHHPFRLGSMNGQSQNAWSGIAFLSVTFAGDRIRFSVPAGVGSYFIDSSTSLHGSPQILGMPEGLPATTPEVLFLNCGESLYVIRRRTK